jgi:hypothetical protein
MAAMEILQKAGGELTDFSLSPKFKTYYRGKQGLGMWILNTSEVWAKIEHTLKRNPVCLFISLHQLFSWGWNI